MTHSGTYWSLQTLSIGAGMGQGIWKTSISCKKEESKGFLIARGAHPVDTLGFEEAKPVRSAAGTGR